MMSKRVFLRPLDLTDLQRIYQWHNDAQLYSTLTGPYHPVGMQAIEQWLTDRVQYSEKEINFAICLTESSEHIGNMYLREIDYVSRNALLGAFIGNQEHRGKGYASEALLQVAEYAFYVLGLNRLYMYVLADNAGAVKHLQKCGFLVEGTMREHSFKNGKFKDVLIFGMCESDYKEHNNTI